MSIAIPPTTAPVAIVVPQTSTASSNHRLMASLVTTTPLTSPKLDSTPANELIAQSELPGGSTPPPPPSPNEPSTPSTRDTGNGYPTSIPTNYFGPAIDFGSGTSFGVISKFSLGENFSLRPSVVFGPNTSVRVPITYNFALGDKEPFERNPLITFNAGGGVQFNSGNGNSQFSILGTVGVDVDLFPGTALVASFNTDFNTNNSGTFGLGFEF